MKLAQEILDEHLNSLSLNKYNPQMDAMYLRCLDAINAARTDTIKLCAEMAKLGYEKTTLTPNGLKDTILLLIKTLK